MTATFRARYEGRCPDCGAEIFTGDLLTYNPDGQAVHAVCSSDKTVPLGSLCTTCFLIHPDGACDL